MAKDICQGSNHSDARNKKPTGRANLHYSCTGVKYRIARDTKITEIEINPAFVL
jgi:ribosomal protein L44E